MQLFRKFCPRKGASTVRSLIQKKILDSVNLNGLWHKLLKLGKMLRIIGDMYKYVKTCVRKCSPYSDFFKSAVGLEQVEVISLLLFSLFIEIDR